MSRGRGKGSVSNPRYGSDHYALRRRWAREVALGGVLCARCGLPIQPDEPWHLDHEDGAGPDAYLGASHERCNIKARNQRQAELAAKAIAAGLDDPAPRAYTPDTYLRPWSRCWGPSPNARCPECMKSGVWACDPARDAA